VEDHVRLLSEQLYQRKKDALSSNEILLNREKQTKTSVISLAMQPGNLSLIRWLSDHLQERQTCGRKWCFL